MPPISCTDCGKQVSSEAPTCSCCSRPIKQSSPSTSAVSGARVYPHCGAQAIGKVRGLQRVGEVLLAIILSIAFLIPRIIYYIYMESVPYCSGCGRRGSERSLAPTSLPSRGRRVLRWSSLHDEAYCFVDPSTHCCARYCRRLLFSTGEALPCP
jgi:hypothetical protein